MTRTVFAAFAAAVLIGLIAGCPVQPLAQEWDPPGTFSIIGFDPETGEVGAAVQSKIFSVGSRNIWADANAGVAVTQATGDTSYGPQALTLLRAGVAPAAIVKRILDDDPGSRPQCHVHVGSKAPWHEITDALPRHPEGLTTAG